MLLPEADAEVEVEDVFVEDGFGTCTVDVPKTGTLRVLDDGATGGNAATTTLDDAVEDDVLILAEDAMGTGTVDVPKILAENDTLCMLDDGATTGFEEDDPTEDNVLIPADGD